MSGLGATFHAGSAPCAVCKEPVLLTNRKVIIEMTGFAPRSRTGGGVNRLFFRKETGRVMCERCFLGGAVPPHERHEQGNLL